ncbi:unnamed protein product [Rhizoctonia solani]|uniref:Uncharacterized protein n=1 Tax=Rhizoctonia solani TaxID=456999 RepID=A0A8H3D346_9AGAM|nr:unnamed protein product [Rhizoctonia solani]
MSFVDSIILSAPQGSNPYAYAAQFVATVIPPKPGWYFANIIASGIVAAINLISTIACFIVMWKRSRAGTGVGLWFFRLRYGHASGVPYIMPNALTMFLFWNLIFMLLMQATLHLVKLFRLSYAQPSVDEVSRFRSKLDANRPDGCRISRMYFWYGFVFIWDATGMWTSAFGTLYATLLPKLFTVTPSDNGPIRRFLLHPITLNLLCFAPPFGLALTQFITSTYSAIGWSNLVHTQFALIDILNALAAEWAQSVAHTVEDVLYQQASDLGTLFLVQKDLSQHAFQKNAWTCGAWYLLCIVLFTPTAVWLLWVIRGTMKQRTRRVTPHAPAPTAANGVAHPTAFGRAQPRSSFAPFTRGHPGNANTPYTPSHTPGAGVNWTVNSQAGQVPQDDSIKQLRRALLTASLQFSATFFCLGMAAGSWLWIAADAGRLIVNPTLHALAILLTIWVYVVVGCLVNLFILIRTRRPDDSSASGNNLPLSAIKASHASSSQSHSRPEPERKRVYIMAHTTTHVVVDDTRDRSSGSDHIHAADVTLGVKEPYDAQGDLESTYSLNSAHGDPTKSKPLDGLEWKQ